MPLNAQQQAMLSSGLNQPVPPSGGTMPPLGGEERVPTTFKKISGVDDGNYGMPFSTGTTIGDSGTIPVNTANPGEHRAQDFNEVGGNVAGLFGRNSLGEKAKTFIPEAKDPLDEQTNTFEDAYSKGYTSTENRKESSATTGMEIGAGVGSILGPWGTVIGGAIGRGIGHLAGGKEGAEGDAGTMRAARLAKRDDRARDQQVRQAAAKDLDKKIKESTGEDWNDFGKMLKRKKRKYQLQYEIRKTQSAGRKKSWKDFKAKSADKDYLDEIENVDQYV